MKAFPLLKKAGCVAALLGLAACGGGDSSSYSGGEDISPHLLLTSADQTGTLTITGVTVSGDVEWDVATVVMTFTYTGAYTGGCTMVFYSSSGEELYTAEGLWVQSTSSTNGTDEDGNYASLPTYVANAIVNIEITCNGTTDAGAATLFSADNFALHVATADADSGTYTGTVQAEPISFSGYDPTGADSSSTISGKINVQDCPYTYVITE